jgi:hypothetical protein
MNISNKLNRIIVAHGEKQKLAAIFGHGMPYIRKVLAGERDTLEALRVRKIALERGGVEVVQLEKKNAPKKN